MFHEYWWEAFKGELRRKCPYLLQVHPLEPFPQRVAEEPTDIGHIISVIEKQVVPAVIAVAFATYWFFGLMFHYGF